MKDQFTVKDILTAVDDILKNQPNNTTNKKQYNETPIKEILGAVDGILKIQSIQKPEEEIIDKKPVKITKIENKNNVLEIKKNLNEKKEKKYDLMIPASTEEFKILKENFLKNEEVKEEINNSRKEKNITKKNYVPIKYKNKSKLNFNKIFTIIFVILIICLILFYENKEQIIIKYPQSSDFYSLLDEFIEYLKEYYNDFIKILFLN